MTKKLVNLGTLAIALRLPRGWLRSEALGDRIPCLRVGRRLLFNPEAVENSLAERAAARPGRVEGINAGVAALSGRAN